MTDPRTISTHNRAKAVRKLSLGWKRQSVEVRVGSLGGIHAGKRAMLDVDANGDLHAWTIDASSVGIDPALLDGGDPALHAFGEELEVAALTHPDHCL